MHASIASSIDQWNYLDKDSFLVIPLFYSVLSEKFTNYYWQQVLDVITF